jgi:hypothetical protein
MEEEPRPVSAKDCAFPAVRGALAGLVGSRVGVEVSALTGSGPFATAIGELAAVREIGRRGSRAIAFDVGDAMLRITERAFAWGWLEEYADHTGQIRWRLVAVELRFGVVIEVEEIPSGR